MQPSVGIVSARNVEQADGIHTVLLIAGVAVGELRFLTAPTPSYDEAKPVAVVPTGEQNQYREYRARVPHPGLWYFWAVDGGSSDTTAPPVPVWVGLSDETDLNLIGYFLRDTLIANKSALEQTLRSAWNGDVTIKSIVYGTAATITSFPAILITKPRETMQYIGSSYLREHRYTFEIFTFLLHGDGYSHLDLSVRLAERCAEILNLPVNSNLVLASGTELSLAQCTEGESDDSEIDKGAWAAVGSIVWSGVAIKQGTPEF